MKIRRVLCIVMAAAIFLSMFAMATPAAASDVTRVVRNTRSRTVCHYYSDEELMDLLHVDLQTLRQMSEDARTAALTNTEWNVSSYGVQRNTDAASALFGIIFQNPECFFVNSVSYYRSGETITRIIPRYRTTYEEGIAQHSEMIAAAQEIVCRFRRDDSLGDLELALLVHDYLAANYSYYQAAVATETDEWGGRYTAYYLLVKGSAVCQGYAEAYAYLMSQLGVTCSMCKSDELNHAWNIIEIDGQEYHVDVTWDDPIYDRSGRVMHTNFLRSTEGLVSTGHDAEDFTGTPDNTKYDDAFWQDSEAAFCLLNGVIYYIKSDGTLCSWVDGKSKTLLTLDYKWYASASSYYLKCYSTLATDGENLFFSSPKKIYQYFPESNTTRAVYTYSNAEDSYHNIYGFTAKNNNFYIDVHNTPNFEVSTQSEKQIVYPYRSGDPDGHVYGEGVPLCEPTCTESYEQIRTCIYCGNTKTEEIAAPGHQYTATVVVPSCTTPGYTTYTCSRCADSYTDDFTDATGHVEIVDAAVAPTCLEAGLTEGSHCSVCNTVIAAQTVIPATGHTYGDAEIVDATCTADGVRIYTCSHCSDSYTEAIHATGHTVVADAATPASCTVPGMTEGSHCSVCNTILVAQETVPALGHDYSFAGNGDGTHTASCSRCDAGVTTHHEFTDGICFCGSLELTMDESIQIYHSLDLVSDISITFAVPQSALTDYDSCFLECVLPEYDENILTGTSTVQIAPVINENYYCFTLSGITAVRMGDIIDSTLHMTRGTAQYISLTDSYSVATYAYTMLNQSTDSKLLTLCADMLRYGAEAQRYKKYRTDALVDNAMTEIHKSYLSNTNALNFAIADNPIDSIAEPTISWVGTTLTLGSKVGIKFVFDTQNYSGNISNLSLRISYQDNNDESKTVTLTAAEAYGSNGFYYSFTFDGLLVSELRTIINATIFEGETQLSGTLRYSAESYASKNADSTLAPLCNTLFAYSDSAKAYFKSAE